MASRPARECDNFATNCTRETSLGEEKKNRQSSTKKTKEEDGGGVSVEVREAVYTKRS